MSNISDMSFVVESEALQSVVKSLVSSTESGKPFSFLDIISPILTLLFVLFYSARKVKKQQDRRRELSARSVELKRAVST